MGVVLLWLFGAMPHWLRRREELAHEHEMVAAESRELVLAGRVSLRASGEGAGTSSAGLLKRSTPVAGLVDAPAPAPVTAAAGGGRAQGKAPDPHPASARRRGPSHARPVARTAARRRGPALPVRAALLALGCALVAAPSALLLLGGSSVVAAGTVGLVSVTVALVALRLRARRRALARTAVLRRAGVRRPLTLLEGQVDERASVSRAAAPQGRRPQQRAGEPRRQAVGA